MKKHFAFFREIDEKLTFLIFREGDTRFFRESIFSGDVDSHWGGHWKITNLLSGVKQNWVYLIGYEISVFAMKW